MSELLKPLLEKMRIGTTFFVISALFYVFSTKFSWFLPFLMKDDKPIDILALDRNQYIAIFIFISVISRFIENFQLPKVMFDKLNIGKLKEILKKTPTWKSFVKELANQKGRKKEIKSLQREIKNYESKIFQILSSYDDNFKVTGGCINEENLFTLYVSASDISSLDISSLDYRYHSNIYNDISLEYLRLYDISFGENAEKENRALTNEEIIKINSKLANVVESVIDK